jgi:hypothetical protein
MKHFVFVTFAAFVLFTTVFPCRGEASTCYTLYFDWECTGWSYPAWDYYFLAIHKDFTFDDEFNNWGFWEYYGSSMNISYMTEWTPGVLGYGVECYPMFGGTKKQGFFYCTDGSYPVVDYYDYYIPGCWYLKKTKLYNCPWIVE